MRWPLWVSITTADLYDRYGRDTSDRVIKRVAMHLGKTSVTGRVFRYAYEEFALVYTGRGRDEVLGDLEMLRADIEDFRFELSPKAHGNGQAGAPNYPAVRWSLTVSVGVAERGEKEGLVGQIQRCHPGGSRGPPSWSKGWREHRLEVEPDQHLFP